MSKIDCLIAAVICVLVVSSAALLSFGKLESGTLTMALAAFLMVGYPLWQWKL